jgi:hypothetical protein
VQRAFAVAILLVVASACSSSSSPPDSTGDCVAVANAEITRSCTNITNGTSYCDAIEGVANTGNCVAQINAFIACAKTAAECQVKTACSSQSSDYASCAGRYCDANTTDTNCVALSDSL